MFVYERRLKITELIKQKETISVENLIFLFTLIAIKNIKELSFFLLIDKNNILIL